MNSQPRTDLVALALAYASFVGLGMASGLLGLAWPSMRDEFAMPLDAAGILLLAGTVGYLLSSFYNGQIMARLGNGLMFTLGSGLIVVGLLGYAVSPFWWLLVASAFVTNLGLGTIDAGLNSYVAAHHSARVMNWLHANFGIGITIGPLIMTAALDRGASWRMGYGVVCIVQLALLVGFLLSSGKWRSSAPQASSSAPIRHANISSSLRLSMVWLSIGLFFIYAGLEATPGQWIYTLFTEARSIPPETAGWWVSVYWGSFTVGRIFFGAISNAIEPLRLLRGCMAGTLFGALLLWWSPAIDVAFMGLTLLGFAQAPLFPVLVSATPNRVGAQHAPNTIGFQMAGAGLGIALVPGLAGVLARHISLEIITPFIAAACVIVIALHERIVLHTPCPEGARQPSGAD